MRRWVVVGLVVAAALVVAGFAVTYIGKVRRSADEAGCKNNLREVAQFATDPATRKPGDPPPKVPYRIPAGTVPLPGVPPEGRLSWYVDLLPAFSPKRQNTELLIAAIDTTRPWDAEKNQQAARTRLVSLLCPANAPEVAPDHPAPTSYVGIAGLGPDAALLAIPPGEKPAAPPRAGCFRYGAPTPFEAITDGTSQTLLVGERSADLGPWLRGGPSTVRGLDDAPGAPPVQGAGGQFGGNHPTGANWGLADGSVRFFTDRVDPKVLLGMATIAGRDNDALPGE